MGTWYNVKDPYSDECEDGIEDVEHAKCSSLVRRRSVKFHLALTADCEADEAKDEELLYAYTTHVYVKT